MLKKLSVKNFRNFKEWIEIDLTTDKAYEFSTKAISDGIVKHGIIYGKNGHGKSNLGLAILDIASHLTDGSLISTVKTNYINANSIDKIAHFKYEFIFDGVDVVYEYGKEKCEQVIYEILTIRGEKVISIDRRISDIAEYRLAGSSALKNDFSGRSISAVKFVGANSLLDENKINQTFLTFLKFVEGMVFFRTLSRAREFQGLVVDSQRISQSIIEQDKLIEFEAFLNSSGIECSLQKAGQDGDEIIEFIFKDRNIEFSQVASTGTMSLGNFYYWYLKLLSGEISFAFIDEFDAYYHFSLSKNIVELVSNLNCQSIITTHNSSLMSNNILRPDCYFVLDDSKLTPLYKLSDRELRKAHNIEKMYRSGAFDE
jgi:AAA15 family ATPase/GTPase